MRSRMRRNDGGLTKRPTFSLARLGTPSPRNRFNVSPLGEYRAFLHFKQIYPSKALQAQSVEIVKEENKHQVKCTPMYCNSLSLFISDSPWR